jgi:hypothetical protein
MQVGRSERPAVYIAALARREYISQSLRRPRIEQHQSVSTDQVVINKSHSSSHDPDIIHTAFHIQTTELYSMVNNIKVEIVFWKRKAQCLGWAGPRRAVFGIPPRFLKSLGMK